MKDDMKVRRNIKKQLTKIVFLIFSIIIATGCSEHPLPIPDPHKQKVPPLTRKVNAFIESAMNDIYLWYKEVPNIDIRYEPDPKAYFNKLLYEEDKWSYITDDIDALEKSFEGVETTYGYSLTFGRFKNTGDIFAIVEYVYPDTPASEAGLERGNIIVLMNNADISDENYTDLLYAESLNITLGILGEGGISVDPNSTVSMTAREMNLDPVFITDVLEHGGHKIGYLFYAQYIENFNPRLNEAFQYFKNEQITDLVIDLRYNLGGGTAAASYLCSLVAPLNVVNEEETLVTLQWNDKYQQHWESINDTRNLKITFTKNPTAKLGLNKLHILTGASTASASELTITGLRPYMEVITVGEKTYGKYTGSITLKPEYFYKDSSYYEDFDNWGIQPIVLKYANSLGETDFKNGFSPDIPVEDDLFSSIPLGNMQDPLLKAAVEDITGTEIIAIKKASMTIPYTIFDRGFSKFDANKREVLFEQADTGNLVKEKK